MMILRFNIVLSLYLCVSLSGGAWAQVVDDRYIDRVVDTSGLREHIPDEEKLGLLEQVIAADPRNLDNYYDYATLATTLREYDKAAVMYERMLAIVPNLPRIKLELAMVEMRRRQFDKAEDLIEDALSGDVPEQVRKNLEPVLAQLEEATKTHHFSGSLSFGAHHDTNANSAPESNQVNVVIAGQELPFTLDENFRGRRDAQFFLSSSLTHEYRHPKEIAEGIGFAWQSSGTYYHNEYDNFDELNIQLGAVRTGPVFTGIGGKLRTGLSAGYNHIILDNQTYQRQYIGELSLQYALDATKRLRLIATETIRDYVNANNNRGLDARDGDVKEVRAGATFTVTPRDFLDVEVRFRNEDTERIFFDNRQAGVTGSYTHQFNDGWYSRAHIGLRSTNYDAPDPSISSKVRKEKEFTAGASVGKSFAENVTGTVGYDYRDVDANITNYSYDNHRFSSTLGWRF